MMALNFKKVLDLTSAGVFQSAEPIILCQRYFHSYIILTFEANLDSLKYE